MALKEPPEIVPYWFHSLESENKHKESPHIRIEFSKIDSDNLENAYQKLLEYEKGSGIAKPPETVDVMDDLLFEVNIPNRQLTPIYWKGKTYEVVRGTWFYATDMYKFLACDEELSRQIEEGYQKAQPWLMEPPKINNNEKQKTFIDFEDKKNWKLTGPYMGQSITYSGPNSAWLLSTNIASQLARAVMTKITNNENIGGTRLIRGYTEVENWKKRNEETNKNKLNSKKEESDSPTGSRSIDNLMGSTSKIPEKSNTEFTINNYTIEDEKAADHRYDKIEHLVFVVHGIGEKFAEDKATSTIESSVNDIRKTAKEVAKLYFCKDKKQHQRGTILPSFETTSENAYKNIYVPEGTGVQFIPVNWRRHMNIDKYKVKKKKHRSRQNLKKSISNTIGKSKEEVNKKENAKNESNDNLKTKSTDYLTPESISSSNANLKSEFSSTSDIDDNDDDDDDEFDFPKMNDILLETIPAVRTIVTDLALDVLYYMVPRFYQQMITILSDEINRLYQLFKKHHPDFNGKVSLFGHSLGSQLCFDILCHQIPECLKDENNNSDTIKYTRTSAYGSESTYNYKQLDFPVYTFFAVGSPIGLFTILSDRNIRFFDWKHPSMKGLTNNDTLVPIVKKMYNIFHPSDPVAHRIEPLILKKKDYINEEEGILKPNPVPYSKGGLTGTVREFQGFQKDFAIRSMKLFGGVYNAVQAFIDPKTETNEIKDEDENDNFDRRNIKHINPHGRLDYVIQADILDNQYLAAIPAHSSYWNDKDTISFVLAELYRDMKFN